MNRYSAVRSKLNKGAARVGGVAAGSLAAFSASAATPTDLAGAAAFMTAQGAIAIAVALAITMVVLGLKGTKLPRRA